MLKTLSCSSALQAFCSTYFFYHGAQEVVHRVRASGCNDEFIFLEFDSFNIKSLMFSEIFKVAKEHRGKKIVIISSIGLLPLAISFATLIGSSIYVFSLKDSLSYVSKQLLVNDGGDFSAPERTKLLSIKEMIILEYTLKGYSATKLGAQMKLSTKTIFYWRKVIQDKLHVRKLHDLLLGVINTPEF